MQSIKEFKLRNRCFLGWFSRN